MRLVWQSAVKIRVANSKRRTECPFRPTFLFSPWALHPQTGFSETPNFCRTRCPRHRCEVRQALLGHLLELRPSTFCPFVLETIVYTFQDWH